MLQKTNIILLFKVLVKWKSSCKFWLLVCNRLQGVKFHLLSHLTHCLHTPPSSKKTELQLKFPQGNFCTCFTAFQWIFFNVRPQLFFECLIYDNVLKLANENEDELTQPDNMSGLKCNVLISSTCTYVIARTCWNSCQHTFMARAMSNVRHVIIVIYLHRLKQACTSPLNSTLV